MTPKKEMENQLDYYTQNRDWEERIVHDQHEIVKYLDDSAVRFFYNEQTEDYDFHWHSALEIIMPVDNHYDVIVPSGTYHILPGEILMIPPGEIHKLAAPENGSRFIFLFDLSVISKLKGFAGIQSMLTSCIHITRSGYSLIYEDIRQLLMQMRNEYFGNTPYLELTIYAQLINLFVIWGGYKLIHTGSSAGIPPLKQKEYAIKFSHVLDYIDEHYMNELTLDEAASFSGFSKYHFSRLFKQYTQTTFYEYLSVRRVKAAAGLLARPDLSITEIALLSGFNSISTFNRIFKQQKNCTPSEFRALYVSKT